MTGKTILVTGGAGFVGTNLIKRLVESGNRVISLDNYFAGSRANHVEGAEYREGHTKDIEKFVPETLDLIYHLGEYSRVEQSVLEPDAVHDLNVVGTSAVIEYWRKRRTKLVYAGSSTKFSDGRHTSPYARTKADNTERIKAVAEREKIPYAITYFYNVFGPSERSGVYGTVIENFKQMYVRGTPLLVTPPGTQERNFTHVDDIVDGLMLIGKHGEGDEFGLGNDRAHRIIDIAKMFGPEIVMVPAREGNRMQSALDASKSHALGWKTKRTLEGYIAEFLSTHPRGKQLEKRILILSTTFHPISGPAEDALCDTMAAFPDVHFDIVTSAFSKDAHAALCPVPNAEVYRVGRGKPSDKYLLPILGLTKARELHRKHQYIFAWALMASYAGLAGIRLKRATELSLLITLADQDLSQLSWVKRRFLARVLTGADQVYGGDVQEKKAALLASRTNLRRSIGDGDAFANMMRFAYSAFLQKRLEEKRT
jgi:UDP-glucose 4-epimerase